MVKHVGSQQLIDRTMVLAPARAPQDHGKDPVSGICLELGSDLFRPQRGDSGSHHLQAENPSVSGSRV